MTPLCISSSPIFGPTDSVPRRSYLELIASSTSLIATCWHHSARCSGVMSILAVLVAPRGNWRSSTVRPTRLTASRHPPASGEPPPLTSPAPPVLPAPASRPHPPPPPS